VHIADFPKDAARFVDAALEEKWAALLTARTQVNAALETLRKDKVIGQSLMANVTLTGGGPTLPAPDPGQLAMLVNTVGAMPARGATASSGAMPGTARGWRSCSRSIASAAC